MSSIEIESDVVDIANDLYLFNNVRICNCDQKYSSHQKCKACAHVYGLRDLHRAVQCNGCASFFTFTALDGWTLMRRMSLCQSGMIN
eukprot:7901912-Ditylum_brightwellii.AAC.1